MSRPLKILIDARFLGRNPYSGVEEYGRQIIENLQQSAPENEYQIIKNRFFGIPNKIFRWLPIKIDQFIKTDLIYSPHLNFLRHSPAAPRVLTIHDISFIHYPYFFSPRQRFWHWLQRVREQVHAAAHIVTDAQYTKNDIMETLKIPPEKISVIYPGIDIGSSPDQQSGKNQNIEKLKPYIFYLGTLEPRKNIVALIKGFNILKDGGFSELKLVIAGRPGWGWPAIAAETEASPFSADIVFRGLVTAEEKKLLYTQAEVFVYPSFFEGFGFPPLEAQINGCPVVAARRASLTEILGDSALLADPWRTDYLADAVGRLLSDRRLRETLVVRGRANSSRFSWNRCAAQLGELFSRYSAPSSL